MRRDSDFLRRGDATTQYRVRAARRGLQGCFAAGEAPLRQPAGVVGWSRTFIRIDEHYGERLDAEKRDR